MTPILLCTLGASWAVIPEAYGFLAPDRLPLFANHPEREALDALRARYQLAAPEEIWVCTTQGEKTRTGIEHLLDWHGLLDSPVTLRIWQAEATDQLASQAECDHMRELILRAALLAHEHARGGQVLLSLAGGRKTMSADLQRAASVFGCQALLHVIENEMPPLLKNPTAEFLTRPLPATDPEGRSCAGAILPLIATGASPRSELLDVALDERPPVSAPRFPLPLPASGTVLAWPAATDDLLTRELNERETAGSRLLGNYLQQLSHSERHENWRSLYRLPPRTIEFLRDTAIGPEYRNWLERVPKADLHRHLGGCLDIPAQRTVGQAIWQSLSPGERDNALKAVNPLLQTAAWPDQWPEMLAAKAPRSHCAAALLVEADDDRLHRNLYGVTEPRVALKSKHRLGFAAYERPGELSGSALLTHPAAIEPYARAVVGQARAEGLLYVELRGSPQKYGDGLAFLRQLRQALHDALPGPADGPVPRFSFTVIADRRQRDRIAQVIELAVEAKNEMPDFVVGLDLAGDEGTTRPEQIAGLFKKAFEICLPITIHAGEGESAESIWQAAYHLHADRIGHGLTIAEHPQLAERFRDRGICLELCPTSNREVVGYLDPAVETSQGCPAYPVLELWQKGLPLTLCTDNPGISRTRLSDEYLTAARMSGGKLCLWDALAMIRQGFTHGFLPALDKAELLREADAQIYRRVLDRFTDAPA
ncbi:MULTISPECIES: CRISPR-associated ring nuclease [Methylococcus]|uniref:adenosine deaminase n=1 Tax=Methylococcus capsulatus TaxID=414 RepID=A0ABZ2F243_METCP|nr:MULTISPECIES: CRISPR-associated ring nuclease [Methylococcus]MDF9391734.1 adenosine deaminase [Methylococcus capsulatus]